MTSRYRLIEYCVCCMLKRVGVTDWLRDYFNLNRDLLHMESTTSRLQFQLHLGTFWTVHAEQARHSIA